MTYIPSEKVYGERWPADVSTIEILGPGKRINLSAGQCDPFMETSTSSSALASRSRISWLPPLPFQLPQPPRSILTSTSLPSLDTPTQPLLTRSARTSTSLTSSSFYDRSTASSRFPHSCGQSTISLTSEQSRYGPRRDAPCRLVVAPSKPDVPPIPEKWKQANHGVYRYRPPLTRGSRPRPPSGGTFETPIRQDILMARTTRSSTSWTDMSDSTKREPSFCRYPILPTSPPKSKSPCKRTAMNQSSSPHSIYEGRNKAYGGATSLVSGPYAQWQDLDDRRDPKGKRRAARRRESRTLVKMRQP